MCCTSCAGGALQPGQPFADSFNLTTRETTINLNSELGHNSRNGVIRCHPSNTGEVEVRFSHNGGAWTGWFGPLLAGEAMDLEQMDLHSLQVRSSVASGDVIAVEAH